MGIKPIIWVASSKRDLASLTGGATREIGQALFEAQMGGKSEKAKPFKGFGSAAVLEVVEYIPLPLQRHPRKPNLKHQISKKNSGLILN